MYSWKAIRARLALAREVPQPVLQAQQMAGLATREVLRLLPQARTVRQVRELQALAAQWELAPEQARAVLEAVVLALAKVPTLGLSSPTNTKSGTQRANSTRRHRRAR
jgi:hypothetical protein